MLLFGKEPFPRIAVKMGNPACRFVAETGGDQAGTVARSREPSSAAKTTSGTTQRRICGRFALDRAMTEFHYHFRLPACSSDRPPPGRCPLARPVAEHHLVVTPTERLQTDEMKILVVEDDRETASYLVKGLNESGYTVDRASDGRDGLFLATSGSYDAVVLDRMLPGMDGLALLGALRAAAISTPALILSALGSVDDRVKGLRAGGDDYLVKPFAFSELLARLEALLRRGTATTTTTKLRVADLELDLLTRTVKRRDKPIEVLPREFRLLEYLMRNAGHVVTRTMLLEHVWDYHFDPQTNVIDVHISRLRQKIDKGFPKPLLHTVRGAGYSLRTPAE